MSKKNTPILSVIVITYNQQDSIAQTLDSIINQEHSYPYEIVVGDDCSTDSTRKILVEYQAKYPDIILLNFNCENLGVTRNYYNALDRCSGKYIMGCAGDDYWLPGKVSAQLHHMENNPNIGVLYGVCHIFDTAHQTLIENNTPSKPKNDYFYALLGGNFIPMLTVCFRRELYIKYVDKQLFATFMMEDFPMWLEFSQHTDFGFLPQPVAVYRKSPNSVSGSANDKRYLQFNQAVLSLQKHFLSSGQVPNPQYHETRLLTHICINCILNEKYEMARYFVQQISLQSLIKPVNTKLMANIFLIHMSIFFHKPFLLMRITSDI